MIDMVLSGQCEKEDIDFIRFEPQDSYISVEHLKPLEIDGKKSVWNKMRSPVNHDTLWMVLKLAGRMRSFLLFTMMPSHIRKEFLYWMLAAQGMLNRLICTDEDSD